MTVASKRHRKVFTSRASTRHRTDKIIAARRARQELSLIAERENVLGNQPTRIVTCVKCQAKTAWNGEPMLNCSGCGANLRVANPQLATAGPRIQSR
jgi:hypothetical protein